MQLINVLAQALKLETDGQEFYNRMTELLDDADGKAMFKQLADDEVDHYNYIKRQYDALQSGKGWAAIAEMALAVSVDAVSLVFPVGESIPKSLVDNPSEEDALLFGLKIENDSFSLYQNSAKHATDPEAKRMFTQLAAAEQRHFEVLMQRYESRFSYPR